MPKLLYISLMRLPTEKAHGLQIMQNCEAFAAAGCHVTLVGRASLEYPRASSSAGRLRLLWRRSEFHYPPHPLH